MEKTVTPFVKRAYARYDNLKPELSSTTIGHFRIGLIGNPSDGFFGKTISLSIANFWAEVTIYESEKLVSKKLHLSGLRTIDIVCRC
jgi:hypothetical protein